MNRKRQFKSKIEHHFHPGDAAKWELLKEIKKELTYCKFFVKISDTIFLKNFPYEV